MGKGISEMHKKWSILLAGFLLSSLEGIAFTWGILIIPLTERFGWEQSEASAPLGIFMITSIAGMIIAGYYQDKYGPAKVSAVGGLLFVLGYGLTSMLEFIPSPYWVMLTYGVIAGSASGVTYACIVPPISKWFTRNLSFAISIALMGSGISTLIFAPIKAAYLLPYFGISGTLALTGLIVSLATFIASWLVRENSSNNMSIDLEKSAVVQSETAEPTRNISPINMLKSHSFWMIWGMYLLVGVGGFIALSFMPIFGVEVTDLSVTEAAWTVSWFSIANALGRPLAGKLADSFGMLKIMFIGYIMQAAVYLMIPLFGDSFMFLLLTAVKAGFAFAISLTVFPVLAAKHFGLSNLGVNYGILSTAYGLAAISPSIGFVIYNRFASYSIVFVLVGLMSAIGAILAVLLHKQSAK